MKKVTITRIKFEEGDSGGTVTRDGDSVTVVLDVMGPAKPSRLPFNEAAWVKFLGLVMKAERAIQESK